jgi:ADP-heptose:LPS heptosyltransferase
MDQKVPNKVQHIAVMRLSAMGDVAMTVPVIRAFVDQNPQVYVTIVSRAIFKPFFEGIPNVSFFVFEEKGIHKGFLGLLRLFYDLKKLNIDSFADLHNVLRSKTIRSLFTINNLNVASLDKGRKGMKALTRLKKKKFKQLPTMFEKHVKVFEKLGYNIDLTHPKFPTKAILDSKTIDFIGSENKILIGIAPFAQYDSKVYPLDLMRQLIELLAKNKDYKILLFGGGKKEIGILNELSNQTENVINIAGKIKFNQELDLISNLNLMLSMDSGNAHIAAMMGVQVVTLWGATHPFAGFLPFNQPLENALVSDRIRYPYLPTSAYGNKNIEGYADVMRTIEPEMVVKKINFLLKDKKI